MKYLRIHATDDEESHFDKVETCTISTQVHPKAVAFEMSQKFDVTAILDTRLPAVARDVKWHTVPERVLTVWLNGSAEYETSDGEKRLLPAGGCPLFDNTHGRGHRTFHSPQEQTVMWISLPHGLDDR